MVMIKDSQSQPVEALDAMVAIIESLNRRFPAGNDIFQRVSRLTEETGELAKSVNHREGMGIKQQKYGEHSDVELVKEVQDVIGAALDIALHYGLLKDLRRAIEQRYQKHELDNFNQ
jgi:NTP pyrophosphatase (non-canonical NTP hydrolase)